MHARIIVSFIELPLVLISCPKPAYLGLGTRVHCIAYAVVLFPGAVDCSEVHPEQCAAR